MGCTSVPKAYVISLELSSGTGSQIPEIISQGLASGKLFPKTEYPRVGKCQNEKNPDFGNEWCVITACDHLQAQLTVSQVRSAH
jgi:hypothetical protein